VLTKGVSAKNERKEKCSWDSTAQRDEISFFWLRASGECPAPLFTKDKKR